jgi:hypothetical protein
MYIGADDGKLRGGIDAGSIGRALSENIRSSASESSAAVYTRMRSVVVLPLCGVWAIP